MGAALHEKLLSDFNVRNNPFEKIILAAFHNPIKKQTADYDKKIIHNFFGSIRPCKKAVFLTMGYDLSQQGIHVPETIIKKWRLYAEYASRVVEPPVCVEIRVILKEFYQAFTSIFMGEDFSLVLFEIPIYLFEEFHEDICL
jgi:hypothetical protein